MRRPTLAVVCGTHHPGPVVAAALSPLRGWADEVIIGADDRVADSDLGWYYSVADRLVTFPFTGRNQFRGWLREQASSDWLLFIDGDEIVSEALIEGIGPLLDDRNIAAHRVSMWWVAPNGTQVLDSKPWSPEYHCRLVRNDDRLYFPSVVHSGPETRGPQRRSELALLHLDLALNDFDTRREKVERYEAQHATQLVDGRSVNSAYYLPELASGVRARSMGEVDREQVATVLSSRDRASPAPLAFAVHRRATSADVRRSIPWEPFDPGDARAEIVLVACPDAARVGTQFDVELRIRNLGKREWPWGWDAKPAVRVSYHWLKAGRLEVSDGLRTALTHPVRAGEDIELTCHVSVPDGLLGSCQLVFDIVAEGDRWFGVDEPVTVVVQ